MTLKFGIFTSYKIIILKVRKFQNDWTIFLLSYKQKFAKAVQNTPWIRIGLRIIQNYRNHRKSGVGAEYEIDAKEVAGHNLLT